MGVALSIKSDEADRLARELAAETGESLTDAVTEAIRERLARTRKRRRDVAVRLMAIADRNRDRPRLDERPEDEILGYDEHGLPR